MFFTKQKHHLDVLYFKINVGICDVKYQTYFVGLAVNYGISNTFVLEIP